MGKRRTRGRDVNGIVLLDKPVGITSNSALQKIKRLFNANKAGHTGSLDPMAGGLLPICLGEATKISGYLLEADKAYTGTCKLGIRTTTADAEGEIIEQRPVAEHSEAEVKRILAQFVGEIDQIPPMHSAIKQNGQPLYKLAHQGKEVERKPRRVTIHSLQLVRLAGDELEISLRCSKGTYVRTLAEDIGRALGCGAHLSALRRTETGSFHIGQAVTLETLTEMAESGFEELDRVIVPMEQALADWPVVQLSENSAFYVLRGQAVQVAKAPTEGWVCLTSDGVFLGIGEVLEDGRVAPRRLVKSG
ncbi:MAG: tRNA pseudouridine(55) synthase TruB [Gammaproteobacteria bacterium]|nr:tRNA pseudouridine(55) synthase TruB [Gammaproteobacteria bacterium]MDH5653037.1 tRNA pseudouridine(55) synthase TruB [Gammaproteobacteria bacterium]